MEVIKQNFRFDKNQTGSLAFIESMRDIPFEIKRVYYIYDVAEGARRGLHAHKNLEEYLICIHGSCTILLDDGTEKREITLSDPSVGLYVGTGLWREMYNFSPGAVLLALAADFYDESDYIREYSEFLNAKREESYT